jgi:hypothetical protein
MRLGKPDTFIREQPAQGPVETDLVLKLAGVEAY